MDTAMRASPDDCWVIGLDRDGSEARRDRGINWFESRCVYHDCFLQSASHRKTARASSRDSACLELDKTFRANVPKVWAVGMSPTSALPCVTSGSILPVGKAFSRKCFSSCFVSANSGSAFL